MPIPIENFDEPEHKRKMSMKILQCETLEEVQNWNLNPQQLADMANWLLEQRRQSRTESNAAYQAWGWAYTKWKAVIRCRPEYRSKFFYDFIKRLERTGAINAKTPVFTYRRTIARRAWAHLCSVIENASRDYPRSFIYYSDKAKWYVYTEDFEAI